MGIQINGNNDIISALDGSWTAEGAYLNTSGIATATTFKGNVTGTACTFVDGNFTGNVTIGGTLTYEDVTNIDSVGLITARDGINLTGGNITLGDSGGNSDDKLVFGADGDLKLFHNGSNNYIDVPGDGNLYVRPKTGFYLQNYTTGEVSIAAIADGKTSLYYNGTQRLATSGIGATVFGQLDIESAGSYIKSNQLKFNPSGHAYIDHGVNAKDISFRLSVSSALDTTMLQMDADGQITKFHKVISVGLQGGNDTAVVGGGSGIGAYLQLNHASTGANTKLMGNSNSWLNANHGYLGIGTANPTQQLEVLGSTILKETGSTDTALQIRGAGTQGDNALISFSNGYTQTFKIGMSDDIGPARDFIISETSTGSSTDNKNPKYIFNGNGDGVFSITDKADGDVKVVLSSNGNSYFTGGMVLIGETSVAGGSQKLVIGQGGAENFEFTPGTSSLNGGAIEYIHRGDSATRPDLSMYVAGGAFKVYTNGNNERLRIDTSGNVHINGTPPWSVSGGNYRNLSISGEGASASGFLWLGNGTATTNADFDLARINICNGGTIVARVCGTTDTSANDDGVLRFITKETGQTEAERLRITSGGNIIPGTNNATNIGDGTTNFNSIWASTRFRGNNNVKLVLGNSQDLVIRHDGSNNIIGSPVGGDLHIKSGTGDNDNQLIACFQHSSGGVIIGAATPTFTSPTPSLTIEKASTGSGPVISLYNGQSANTASTCEILVRQNYRDSNKIIFGRENNNNWQASAASVASYTAFHTNSGSGITERLRITSDGKVAAGGSGTGYPSKLQSHGAGNLLDLNSTSGAAKILFYESGTGRFNIETLSGSSGIRFYDSLNSAERLRIDSSGRLGLGSGATVHAYIDVRQAIDDNPLLNLGHNDGSFYRHLGTVGPATDDGRNGGSYRYMHIRLRTVWNDASMTMFRITGYHSYNDYTESYFGCYRYNNSGYRTNPYGQVIHNQKRATLHSVYNTGASPGYLVLVLDSSSNYSGFIIEHIGAGNSYGSMMQHDLEIIDTKRDTTTNDQWP